jgi:hypothetical protein
MLDSAAGRAGREGQYNPPPGTPVPKRRRRPASLRHIAEVIRTNRLAPGAAVDKDDVSRVLSGKPGAITDALLVVAVARACHHIAGHEFDLQDAARYAAAAARITALTEAAHAADERAPYLVPVVRPRGNLTRLPGTDDAGDDFAHPYVIDGRTIGRRWRWPRGFAQVATTAGVALIAAVLGAVVALQVAQRPEPAVSDLPCRDGTAGEDLVESHVVGPDEDAQVIEPFLDFDEMNGSARYNRYRGRTYYWGRAGSDDNVPRSGGARIRWQPAGGQWRSCPVTLARSERDYVRTMAVATTIGGHAVRVQVCLWRDEPFRENCTQIFS